METILKKINDPQLYEIKDCINLQNLSYINEIRRRFPEYDDAFLWLVCYPREGHLAARRYIEESYKKYHQILDKDFLEKLVKKGSFESRLWEMILCDILSSSGEIIPKGALGADFELKLPCGQKIQVEAVAPDEADDTSLRAERPNFSKGNFYMGGGEIEDMERPILLRVFDKGFIEKAKNKNYDKKRPLIIAINSSKVVGLVSNDEYILRRMLFGLGYITITKIGEGSITGLAQNQFLNKPGKENFGVGVFRSQEFKHVSGVIYTSQRSQGFIGEGYSWSNSGITYVPNPMATNRLDINFPFFKKLICNDQIYQEMGAERKFESTINLVND